MPEMTNPQCSRRIRIRIVHFAFRNLMCMVILFLLLFPSFLHAQGYHVVGNRYMVDRAEDWRGWNLPKRAAVIALDGSVMPFRTRRGSDPMKNAEEYVHRVDDKILEWFPFHILWESGLGKYGKFYITRGGIKNAGSNLEDAEHVLDGDPATYWAPDPSDSLYNWWIELDLGRAVTVNRIVLRFLKPFKQFKVLVSNGSSVGLGTAIFDWRQVYISRWMTEEDPLFEIPVESSLKRREGDGDVIQYIRIQATDQTDRGLRVSKAEYEALPPSLQGLREYFRRTERGGVIPVSQEAYEELPIKERGAIWYYTRPRPRIGEVEVHAVGDNIAVGLLDRGGTVDNPATSQPIEQRFAVDGSFVTNIRLNPPSRKSVQVVIDLGATFWVDDIRIIADRDPWQGGSALTSYRIEVSDGTMSAGDELVWEITTGGERLNIPDGLWRTHDPFDLRKVRHVRLTFVNKETGMYSGILLREVQVYGTGYVPDVMLESPVMDLGLHRAISFVRWGGDTPSGTAIEIRTRAGDRLTEVTRFYDIDGNEVTHRRWHKLPGFLRLAPAISEEPGDDWSDWSARYAYSGELVRSPTPSRYVQFQVRLLSEDPEAFASLQSLSFETFPPLVHHAAGEITPEDAAQPGQEETFTLFAKLSATPTDRGFDEFVLTSPHVPKLVLESVYMAPEDEVLGSPELSSADFTLVPSGPDSIRLRFPHRRLPLQEQVLMIRFGSVILRRGTRFLAYLRNRSLPEISQEIWPGDATVLSDTQTMTVGVPVDPKVLGRLDARPNPFSPNGDGANDVLELAFMVLNIYPPKSAEATILDLQGRVLRWLVDWGADAEGRHLIRWDGRDETGRLVPPGIYLARVLLHADAPEATRTALYRIVYVVY